jgi:hypothetical protein
LGLMEAPNRAIPARMGRPCDPNRTARFTMRATNRLNCPR